MNKKSPSVRLKQIMSERNLKQVDILNMSLPYQKELNITMSKSHLSQYVNGKSNPDQNKLYLLSKTLDVNEAWLMGFDVAKERIPDNFRNNSEDTQPITFVYNQLNKERKNKVDKFAEEQLQEQLHEQNNSSNLHNIELQKSSLKPKPQQLDEDGHDYTLAAHSADPTRKYSNEDIVDIKSKLAKARKKYEDKNK